MLKTNFSLRLGAAAILLAAAAPAFAAEPSRAPADGVAADTGGAPAPATTEARPAKEERKICRFDSATGSNVRGKKICLTARQWRARQD
jgi:hypothetical protein